MRLGIGHTTLQIVGIFCFALLYQLEVQQPYISSAKKLHTPLSFQEHKDWNLLWHSAYFVQEIRKESEDSFQNIEKPKTQIKEWSFEGYSSQSAIQILLHFKEVQENKNSYSQVSHYFEENKTYLDIIETSKYNIISIVNLDSPFQKFTQSPPSLVCAENIGIQGQITKQSFLDFKIIQNYLEKLNLTFKKPLIIAGNGYGGNVAALLAYQFHKTQIPIHEVYLFGTPKMGNQAFADHYHSLLKDKTYHITHPRDVTPFLPPQPESLEAWKKLINYDDFALLQGYIEKNGYASVGVLRGRFQKLHEEKTFWQQFTLLEPLYFLDIPFKFRYVEKARSFDSYIEYLFKFPEKSS